MYNIEEKQLWKGKEKQTKEKEELETQEKTANGRRKSREISGKRRGKRD